jgi:hypothetical protein
MEDKFLFERSYFYVNWNLTPVTSIITHNGVPDTKILNASLARSINSYTYIENKNVSSTESCLP